MERRSQARVESGAFVFIVLAALIVFNVLALKVFHWRVDLTKRRLYSLSEGTRRTLGRLTDTMTVTVYWTPDQPPPANDDQRLLREQLDEYVAASNGRIAFEWVTTDNDDRKHRAEGASCQPRVLQAVRNGSAQATEAFRCITFSYLTKTERIDFVNPGVEGLEYEVTSLIKKILDPERTIGFLTGHEEGTPDSSLRYLSQLMDRMHVRYTTRNVDLHAGNDEVPTDIKGLIINNPTGAISERELRRINAYLMRGGSVAVFAGGINVTGNDSEPSGSNADHNLNALLNGYGLSIQQNIVLDPRAAPAIVETPRGRARFSVVTFPFIAQEGINQWHSSVFRLPLIVTPFVSSLNVDRSRIQYCDARDEEEAKAKCGTRPALITIGRTSEASVLHTNTSELALAAIAERAERIFNGSGPHGPYTVAVALAGPLPSAFTGDGTASTGDGGAPATPITAPERATADHPARLLVVSSGKMFGIEQLQEIAPLQGGMPTNIQMLFNTFDWLSQDSDLLAVRAKSVSEPDLSVTSDTKKKLFQWGTILGLPAFVGVLGWFLMNVRAKRRAEIKL
jgi:ABC-2 type transport system permease protein